MKAFIMAAGFGTRLEPLTLAVPKPMVYVANKPIMQHNLELLKRAGITDVCANIHYFPEQIENFFDDGSRFGINLSYSYEENLLGTAGGVRRMAEVVGGVKETFIVLSSDALTDIDLPKLIEYHKEKKGVATIALYSVLDTSQFGVVILDEKERVAAFQEKPVPGKALSNLANTGIYVFEPEIIDMMPKNKFFDFGNDLFPKLAGDKRDMYGYQMSKYWSDVGNLSQYMAANADVLNGMLFTEIPEKKMSENLWTGRNVKIGKNVKFEGPVLLGDGVEISDGVKIEGPSVIGDKVIVADGANIKKSVVWSGVVIGETSLIDESIIGSWCHIGAEVSIDTGCVIGNRCRIARGTRIPEHTKMRPNGHM